MTARPARLLVGAGACCVVAGGLVAAVTGPLRLANGSWLAAYLVLVGGVAQYALGRVPSWLAGAAVSAGPLWWQLGCWNAGNALVVGGTVLGVPVLVDVGGVALVVALVVAARSTHAGRGMPLVGAAYRLLLVVLAVSVPVGAVLAHLRT